MQGTGGWLKLQGVGEAVTLRVLVVLGTVVVCRRCVWGGGGHGIVTRWGWERLLFGEAAGECCYSKGM